MFGIKFKSLGGSIGEAAANAAIKEYRIALEKNDIAIVPAEATPRMLNAVKGITDISECYRKMIEVGRVRPKYP